MNRRSLFKLLGGTAAAATLGSIPKTLGEPQGHVQRTNVLTGTVDMDASAFSANTTSFIFTGSHPLGAADDYRLLFWDAHDQQWLNLAERET